MQNTSTSNYTEINLSDFSVLSIISKMSLTLTIAFRPQIEGSIKLYKEHTNGARPSTKNKHEKGQTRKNKDNFGEKGDARRKPNPNKRRPNYMDASPYNPKYYERQQQEAWNQFIQGYKSGSLYL